MTRLNPTRVQPPTVQMWRLYRFWDSDGRLLYIGQTGRMPLIRALEHLIEQGWAGKIARWEVDPQPYYSEADVLAAEKAAIVAEMPVHNWEHNGGNPNRVWVPKVAGYRHPGRRATVAGSSARPGWKAVLLSPWAHWLLAWTGLLLAAWIGLGWAADKTGHRLTDGLRFEASAVVAAGATGWLWWRRRGRRIWRRWKRRIRP